MARSFPKPIRNVLMVAARGRCRVGGCDAPFAWLQVDHHQPYSKGGPTRADNGHIRCDPDNKHKTDTWPPPPNTLNTKRHKPPDTAKSDKPPDEPDERNKHAA